jgi:translation initiation factor 2 subunit 1
MFYRKKGFPEEGEIVLCTVKKILYHSVFAVLDEYQNIEGMIHISEISPGRIRNIRDYVKEGKQIVCKILKIDKQKGHIDLSIRRVGTNQKRNKNSEWKQEAKAEKLLELIGKDLDKNLAMMYKEVGYILKEEYGTLNKAFERFVMEPDEVTELNLPKKLEETLIKIVLEKIQPKKAEVKGILELSLETPNGVEVIKKTLTNLQKGEITITYISAPKYKLKVTASDYKTAEGILKQVQEDAISDIESAGGTASFSKLK